MKFNKFWLACCLLPGALLAQKNTTVRLQWGLAPGDTLRYITHMENLDTAQESAGVWGGMLNPPVLVSELTCQRRGLIGVSMYARPSEAEKKEQQDQIEALLANLPADSSGRPELSRDSMRQTLESAFGARQNTLTGAVYADGGLQSFYLPSGQKNILALFFELPKQAVRVGDTWDLDVQLLSTNANRCDSVFYLHRATCKSIRKQSNDQIAVISYDFREYFGGKTPFSDNAVISFSYQAEAEFSVKQGRWLKYEGVLDLKMDALFGPSSTRQRFALVGDRF